MELFIAIGLLAIAAILFYRFVERRHKVLLGRVLLTLAALGGVATGISHCVEREREAAALREERAAEERQSARDRSVDISLWSVAGKARERLGGLLPSIPGARGGITFRLCNRGRDTVHRVTFWPKAFTSGRSTAYPVAVDRPYAPSNLPGPDYPSSAQLTFAPEGIITAANRFSTDAIIPPGACFDEYWNDGAFLPRDSVALQAQRVTTR